MSDGKYISLFDQRETNAQHYAIEIVLMRQAEASKKTLPFKYWSTDEWKPQYKREMIKVNSLIKIFGEENLIRTLREHKWIKTLYVKKLPDLIKEKKVVKTELVIVEEEYIPVKTDKLSKLRDL